MISHRKNLLSKLGFKDIAGIVRRDFRMHFLQVAASIALFLFVHVSHAQTNNFELATSINDTGEDPDSSSILDISSTSHGMLIPRMTMIQRDLIAEPATSLLIYQTDDTPGFYFNAGTPLSPSWQSLHQLAVDASQLIDDDDDTKIELTEASDDDISTTVDGVVTMTSTADLWQTNTPESIRSTSSEAVPALLLDNTQDNLSHIGFRNTGFSDNRFFISADPSSSGGSVADMRFLWKNINSGTTINFLRMVASGGALIELKQDVLAELDFTISGDLLIGDDGDITDSGTDALQVGADWLPSSSGTFDLGSNALAWEDLFVDDIRDIQSISYDNDVVISQSAQGITINGPIGVDKNNLYDLGTSTLRWKTMFTQTTNTSTVDDIGGGNISADANWLPALDCNYTLGSSTLRWDVLFAKEVQTGELILTPVPPPTSNMCNEEGQILLVDDINGQNEGSVYLLVCIDDEWRPL